MYEMLLYILRLARVMVQKYLAEVLSRYIESNELTLTKLKRKDHGRIIVYRRISNHACLSSI